MELEILSAHNLSLLTKPKDLTQIWGHIMFLVPVM